MTEGILGSGKLGAAVVFVGAAALEVAGDALIRKGLRGSGALLEMRRTRAKASAVPAPDSHRVARRCKVIRLPVD
ncbi:MAG TPA: hypothetical protein VLV16_10370 [Gemmatimonadales bacterium]|nr:hypothetical protein [Gemmatimonadales bacterium]